MATAALADAQAIGDHPFFTDGGEGGSRGVVVWLGWPACNLVWCCLWVLCTGGKLSVQQLLAKEVRESREASAGPEKRA